MKIKTRLLLFLLPTVIGCIALIALILSFNWQKEVMEGFKIKLQTTVESAAALINDQNSSALTQLKEKLEITGLYLIPLEKVKLSDKRNPAITRQVYISPIHKTKDSPYKIMTAFAPVIDKNDKVISVIAADISLALIDKKLQDGLLIVILSALATIILVAISLFLIADKISKPVQKLNNAALFIAAGQYGSAIKVKGPKEIVELSNTLNTMSECLQENINRLKENSLVREKMYGKYESALLLQKYMLQKVIEECKSDTVAVNAISLFSDNPKGLFLDFPKMSENELHINLVEALERGFEGMYALLTNYQLFKEGQKLPSPFLRLILNTQTRQMTFESNSFNPPLIWSLKMGKIIKTSPKTQLSPGDFFFLYNQGLANSFEDTIKVKSMLTKVLKFFAEEGLETCSNMLEKELFFASKRKELEEDFHLLCFQLLY